MSAFVGTGQLLRLALRRDRTLLPVWIALFAGMGAISASATLGLYPTEQSRVIAATAANATPSLVAMYGPIYDPTSLGALSMLKMTVLG
ncbi:MAG: ABC transporter permease, partial [Candidatus Nanopelagicales bacterium]|nr:ABC transporter permease [Candidatus Nanopelagicales bacterium]